MPSQGDLRQIPLFQDARDDSFFPLDQSEGEIPFGRLLDRRRSSQRNFSQQLIKLALISVLQGVMNSQTR
ncbi:hypothetical protein O181_004867 [Austropuccinia psidii MF-1]|uniref:Uncharacterized protein n=1 Tax=Austropuccinia psidii MF-1 TaxID=1389203 RepID=A0A9Q3BHP3_9BASI|nr:hypothetical protein [Austropuccinia psidii MF-1]